MDNETNTTSLIPEILPKEDPTAVSPTRIASPADLQPFIADFLTAAREQNRPESYRGYEKSLKRFTGFWAGPGRQYAFGARLCQAFKVFLEEEKLSANTRQVYLSALRLFGQSLVSGGIVKWNPMEGIRSPKISVLFKKQPLSIKGAEALINTLKERTLLELRDKTILYLMLKTGMREIEVVRADVADYQTVPDGQILRVQGKGRHDKDEFVVIVPEVKALLDRYLMRRVREDRKASAIGKAWPDLDEPLFLTLGKRQGNRLKPVTMQGLVRWWLTAAQVKRPVITGHSLRHTAATMSLNGGAPITAVKDMLRHASIKQTNIYVHTLDRLKKGGESFITQY